MRFKVLPEPVASLGTVAEVRDAVPLVPDEEESCCARLVRRTDVGSQDHAKEWLTFLRALGLVEETDGRYRRVPAAGDEGDGDSGRAGGSGAGAGAGLDRAALRTAFRERIYLVEEVLATVEAAEEPPDVDAVFDRVGDRLPAWERMRHTDPEAVWRERVRRVLEWAVVLGALSRTDGGYVRPDGGDG